MKHPRGAQHTENRTPKRCPTPLTHTHSGTVGLTVPYHRGWELAQYSVMSQSTTVTGQSPSIPVRSYWAIPHHTLCHHTQHNNTSVTAVKGSVLSKGTQMHGTKGGHTFWGEKRGANKRQQAREAIQWATQQNKKVCASDVSATSDDKTTQVMSCNQWWQNPNSKHQFTTSFLQSPPQLI